jgi:hypothetical protein
VFAGCNEDDKEKEQTNPKDLQTLVDEGTAALESGDIDTAISSFEAAYRKDSKNPTAIVYSTLGQLASIAVDPNVKALMQNRLGLKSYPSTINALIAPDWMETYTDERLQWWYYDGNDEAYWWDSDDSWFFDQYDLERKDGYYKYEQLNPYVMTLGETTQRYGQLDSYYDDSLDRYVEWYDYNPNWGTGTAGYYYWDWENYTYTFVTSTPYEDYLDYYYSDSDNHWYQWWDSEPHSNDYTGYTVPGYYWTQSGTYILVSETPIYEIRGDEKLPGMNVPTWLTGTDAYKESLTSQNLKSPGTFALLMGANLIEKNTTGLNALLDDLLSSVFGTKFENAYGRIAGLNGEVRLDAETLAAFGIDDIFDGDAVYIGKAELNVLFAALRIVKASLEWITAYDWNTDVNFLKSGAYWSNSSSFGSPANLPLRNNFLKDRNNGMMARSKADFVKAIEDSIAAYDLWIASNNLPSGFKDTLGEYKWAKDGFSQFKTLINNGGTFYVKEHNSTATTYTNTEAGSLFGIDLGKFFTPGFLSIDKLIENEQTGKGTAPVFYGVDYWYSTTPTKITSKESINNYDEIGFKLKTDAIKEIIVYGAEDLGDTVIELFSRPWARTIWDWYN